MKRTEVSTGQLVFGVVAGWGLSIVICCWLLTVPAFDDKARIEVVGEVMDVATPVIRYGRALEFTVRGEPSRLRVLDPIFAKALHHQVPPELVSTAKVRALVGKEDYENPHSPAPLWVPTVYVDKLEVDGKLVLSLADSRQWHDSNRNIAWVLAPVFCLMSLFLTAMLVKRLKYPSS